MSDTFPDKIIETPFGRITQGDFLDRTDWSLQDKIFVKEIWKALPQVSLKEMLKVKEYMSRGEAAGRAAAKLFLKKQAKARATQKRERAEIASSVSLGKTAAHPKIQRSRRKQPSKQNDIQSEKSTLDSIGKTGSFSQMGRAKRQSRYPVFAQIGEGKFFTQIKCKSCENVVKVPLEKAGRMYRCSCHKEFKVPDGYFYLKKYPDAKVQGPFLISRHRELIEQKILTVQVYLSGDKEKWQKVEDGDPSVLLLIAKYALSTQEKQLAMGKITVSHLLARCAVEVQDSEIQEIAIEKIEDQQLLGKVIEHLSNTRLITLVLDKIDNQKIIAEFVKNTEKQELIADAMEKISDQRILAGLACDIDEHVRWHAIRKLTDQVVLQKLALGEKIKPLRLFAVGKLNNGKTLLHVALNDREADVQVAAIKKISDRDDLVRIAKEAGVSRVRVAATCKIDDREILLQIVQESKDVQVRKAAVGNISDQRLLERVVMEIDDLQVQISAINMIADSQILAQIAKSSKNDKIIAQALAKLTPQALTSLILKEKDGHLRKTAVRKVVDCESLAKIYRESKDDDVRWISVHNMTDQTRLMEIAVESDNVFICCLAESRIIDPVLMAKVAAESKHEKIRRESARKIGEFIERVDDPELIAKILINSKGGNWQTAIGKIHDQAILASIALKAVDDNVRISVLQELREIEPLEQIAEQFGGKISKLAMEKIAKLRPTPAQDDDTYTSKDAIDSEEAGGILIDSEAAEGILIDSEAAGGILIDSEEAGGILIDSEVTGGILIGSEEAGGILIGSEAAGGILIDSEEEIIAGTERSATQNVSEIVIADDCGQVWVALQKLAKRDNKSIMEYFSPVVLKKLAQTTQSEYDSNILWKILQKIATKNTALLGEYLSPAAMRIVIKDSLSF